MKTAHSNERGIDWEAYFIFEVCSLTQCFFKILNNITQLDMENYKLCKY